MLKNPLTMAQAQIDVAQVEAAGDDAWNSLLQSLGEKTDEKTDTPQLKRQNITGKE